ncbi:MAG: hypothetical protein OXH33_05705 [bacterium]|nr:hypothetical protein [bacterium]
MGEVLVAGSVAYTVAVVLDGWLGVVLPWQVYVAAGLGWGLMRT